MSKHIFTFLLLITFFLQACVKVEKNVNDYYPQVKTVSATVNPDGSVTVTGQVLSAGSTPVAYCGFCMDTVPNPDMLANQVLVDTLFGNTFTYTYSSFNANETYYFRAFITNTNGYAIGTAIPVNNISFDTSQIPCHPASQYLVLTGNGVPDQDEPYTYVNAVTQSGTGYEVSGYTSDHAIDINFGQYPVSGVYTITNASTPAGMAVLMTVDGIAVSSGAKLYVQQINSTTIDITICSANATIMVGPGGNYYPYTLTTKFRSPS